MWRRLTATILAVTAGLAGPALAAAPPRAQLTGFACQRARQAPNRFVSVTPVMRPQPGTRYMEMRFVLLRRLEGSRRFAPVEGGDLGSWKRAPGTLGQEPGDVWRVAKTVVNLPAPAVYRFKIIFRWELSAGRLDTVLWTPRCYQS